MQATVTHIEDGKIKVRIRRNTSTQSLYNGRSLDLKVGDKITVKRQTNNPYLIFVEKV